MVHQSFSYFCRNHSKKRYSDSSIIRKRKQSSESSTSTFETNKSLKSSQLQNASTQTGNFVLDYEPRTQARTSSLDMHIGTSLNNTPSGIRCCCSDQNCEVAKQSKTSIETLNKKISHLTEQLKMNARDLEFISVSDDKCLYYTGISSFKTVQHLFNYLKDNISQPHCNFTKEQVFVMTLTKLRLNHQFQTLAYDYKVCPNTISKYFHRLVKLIEFDIVIIILKIYV